MAALARLALWTAVGVLAVPGIQGSSAPEALVHAARDDDRSAVSALLQRGADPDAREGDGATALAWAAIRGNSAIAALLLDAGADPDAANALGITPLALAIENGAGKVARLILESGADPDARRESGESPLMTATRLGQVDLMALLLDRGADPNARESRFGQSALMWAAGNPEAVRLLLGRGADVLATTKSWDVRYTIYAPTTFTLGKTGIPWNTDGEYVSRRGGQNALFFAIREHDMDSVRMLLRAGIGVNGTAADGTTPLLASMYNWVPLDDDFQPGQGAPARAGSSQRFGPHLDIAGLLLDHGATATGADAAGYTPLHAAALAIAWARGPKDEGSKGVYRHLAPLLSLKRAAAGSVPFSPEEALETVKRLLAGGADANRPTLYTTPGPSGDVRINPAPPGSTPLHVAADSSNVELVRMLLNAGADPNHVRKDGHSPFSVAVVARDLPVVKEMVAHGADLLARYDPDDRFPDPVKAISLSRQGQSIAHLAAGNKYPELVAYLHAQGAPLHWRNEQGETPLDLADHQERFQEALDRQNTDGDPERLRGVVRKTETTDTIKRLAAAREEDASDAPAP